MTPHFPSKAPATLYLQPKAPSALVILDISDSEDEEEVSVNDVYGLATSVDDPQVCS